MHLLFQLSVYFSNNIKNFFIEFYPESLFTPHAVMDPLKIYIISSRYNDFDDKPKYFVADITYDKLVKIMLLF